MAGIGTRESALIDKLLKWLTFVAEKGFALDEFELFRQVAATDPRLRQRVSNALESTGAPALAALTRDQYYALTPTQFDAALAELLAELGLTIEEARKFFCVKLNWCERRRGWKGFVGRLLKKVPPKWRSLVKVAGAAAPWIWEAISILLNLSPAVAGTLLAVRLSAYLASGALDKLCKC
jgi:hypothetical protein